MADSRPDKFRRRYFPARSASINQLKSAIEGAGAPLAAMGAASVDAAQAREAALTKSARLTMQYVQALEQLDGAYVAAFRSSMQAMADQKQITLQQALGFDIQYTTQLSEQERSRLAEIVYNDRAMVTDRQRALNMMIELDALL